jgi:trans-aconitate 2-methyltransferase
MTWDPETYLSAAGYKHRLRPALDLIARIPCDRPARIADLGCGVGEVTCLLGARWPQAEIVGIDNSAEMLAHARTNFPEHVWQLGDVSRWQPNCTFDLIVSNSTFQWIGEHEELLPRLLDFLSPGGVLAVQMPRNFAAPSHLALAETVATGPWRARLEHLLRREPVAPPTVYHRLLSGRAASLDLWETDYLQVLDGRDPVVEWMRPTGLRPFLQALEDTARDAFEAEYRRRVGQAYPPEADGRTLYPFRRLFLVAIR